MKTIDLPSGAKLVITPAPFKDANALYKAVASEAKSLTMLGSTELDVNLIKDAICTLVSSDNIESKLWKCFERCTYESLKITDDTFEDEKAREDYFTVCKEVLIANVSPFWNGLYAKFSVIADMMKKLTHA